MSVNPKGGSIQEQTPGRRVVVVGDEPLRAKLAAIAAASQPDAVVVGAPTFLMAVGEAATQPVEAVIGRGEALGEMAEPTERALKQIDAETRLLVIGTSSAGGQGGAEPGCSSVVIPEPVSAERLAEALGWSAGGESGHDAEPDAKGVAPGAAPGAARPEPEAAGGRPAGPEPTSGAELGDVDLIETILERRGPVSGPAMRLIASQSGIAQIALTPEGAAPQGHARAEVSYAGTRFGVLHAPPPARQDELAPWAGWLARWMALGQHVERMIDLSLRDPLTGVWNRRYFDRFLRKILGRASADRSQVTLLVFDIDDFKLYNDRYGHSAGDEILSETARMMQAVVRDHDVVARIGGDEFAVIFWDAEGPRRPHSRHPQDVLSCAKRFQKAICSHRFPKLLEQGHGTLTISGGLSSFPWDGRTPQELLEKADQMAIRSKQQGKNAITLCSGALRECGLPAE